MLSNVSPYELLCASRPAVPAAAPYDLYSRLQQESAPSPEVPPTPQIGLPAPLAPLPPVKKTHYISDIHMKHSTAGRRAAFVNQPLT